MKGGKREGDMSHLLFAFHLVLLEASCCFVVFVVWCCFFAFWFLFFSCLKFPGYFRFTLHNSLKSEMTDLLGRIMLAQELSFMISSLA